MSTHQRLNAFEGSPLRTAGIIGGGIALSVILAVLLTVTIAPDTERLLAYQLHIRPITNIQLDELNREIRINGILIRYVITPLVGVGVGAFVGFFQRSRPVLVTIFCLIPGSCAPFIPAHISQQPFLRVEMVTPHLLSIGCGALVAFVVWRLRRKRKNMEIGTT